MNTSEGKKVEAAAQGLFSIATTLAFLHQAGLVHNNVCSAAVFVDRAGLWKLHGLEYVHKLTDPAIQKTLSSLTIYDPPETPKKSTARRVVIAGDTWRLGCLLWEAFKGNVLPENNALGQINHIPNNLKKVYMQLVGANPTRRPTMDQFIEQNNSVSGDFFYDCKVIRINKKLDTIQLAEDKHEKDRFIEEVDKSLDILPEPFCRYRVLPKLVDLFKYGGVGVGIFTPLLKIAQTLPKNEYASIINPLIVNAVSSNDRSTRVYLLKNIDKFIDQMDDKTVNQNIFPPICSGFNDTNPAIREQTVKCMLVIGSRLDDKNLNVELMKHFAKLQAKDDQAPIRCNTTICLGKLLKHLNIETKQKVMNSAFNRAMKDPFPPARQAGLNAILANASEYKLQDLAMKMLPGITPLLCDPEKTVRQTALKAARQFLSKIEDASSDPDKEAELVGNAPTGNENVNKTSGSNNAKSSSTLASVGGWLGSAATNAASAAANAAASKMRSGGVNKPQSNTNMPSSNICKTMIKILNLFFNSEAIFLHVLLAPPIQVIKTKAEPSEVKKEPSTNGWDDDGEGDNWDEFDDASDYEEPTPSEPTITEKMAKADLSRATKNIKSKSKMKSDEADIWSNLNNDKDDGWGSSTKNSNNESSNWENTGNDDNWGNDDDGWGDDWGAPKKAPVRRGKLGAKKF